MKSMNDFEKVQKTNLYPMTQGNKMQRKEKIRSNTYSGAYPFTFRQLIRV